MPAKNIVAGLGAVGILAAGIVVGNLKGNGEVEPTTDGGVVAPIKIEKTIEQVAPIAIVSASGKKVFVVGEARPENPTVTESDLGKVVMKTDISGNALCNVVFEAKLTKQRLPKMPHDLTTKEIDAPDFKVNFGHVNPIMIPGSCDAKKFCIFNTLLHGEECLKAVDLPGYLGSTMGEFLKLPVATQRRFLKQQGKCKIKIHDEMREITCHVPIGDEKADKDADVIFPHGWANRVDLNPLHADTKDGKTVAVDRADLYMGDSKSK